jgi:hypothetical protein
VFRRLKIYSAGSIESTLTAIYRIVTMLPDQKSDLPRGFACYEIIGNCYVHGYMNGEIAASGDYGQSKECNFSVVEGRIARVQIEGRAPRYYECLQSVGERL